MKKPINYNYNATDYEIYWNEYRGYEINIDVLNIIVENMKKNIDYRYSSLSFNPSKIFETQVGIKSCAILGVFLRHLTTFLTQH